VRERGSEAKKQISTAKRSTAKLLLNNKTIWGEKRERVDPLDFLSLLLADLFYRHLIINSI